MSNCKKCGSSEDCSCKQKALGISQICNPIDCPSDECTESFKAECIIYTGEDIICNDVILVTNGNNLAQAIANTIAYFCQDATVPNDIGCGQDIVVLAGTDLSDALELIVAYFCAQIGGLQVQIDTNVINIANNAQGIIDTAIVSATTNQVCVDEPPPSLCRNCTQTINLLNAAAQIVTTFQFSFRECDAVALCGHPLTDPFADTDTVIICRDTGNGNYDVFSAELTNFLNAPPTVYGLYAQTADAAAVVDPIIGSLIGPGVGTLVLPLNSVGNSFRAKLSGIITCSNTQELTIYVKDGNGNFIGSSGLILTNSSTNGFWDLELDITLRSTGVTGEVVTRGKWSYIPTTGGPSIEASQFTNVNPINTTIVNTLEIQASFNFNEGGTNSITTQFFTLTKTY